MKKGRKSQTHRSKSPSKSGVSKTRVKKTVSASKKTKKKPLGLKKRAAKAPSVRVTVSHEDDLSPKTKAVLEILKDLPFSYNETKLVLLPRDPQCCFAYWDFSTVTWEWIQGFARSNPDSSAKIRVYNIEDGTSFDADINLETKNWYLQLDYPNMTVDAELGFLGSDGTFYGIVKSNRVTTPRNGPSDKIDPDWEIKDFETVYRLSGGHLRGNDSNYYPI